MDPEGLKLKSKYTVPVNADFNIHNAHVMCVYSNQPSQIYFQRILTGDHLCGKLLFTWLSLVVSMMVPFCAAFFPRDALDEIWDLIESVSEGFPKYSYDIKYVSFMIQKKYKMSTIIDILTPLGSRYENERLTWGI